MKKMCILLLCLLLVFPTAAFAKDEAAGSAHWENDHVFINGISIPSLTLADGFAYLHVQDLVQYGFSVQESREEIEDSTIRTLALTRNPYYPITELRRTDDETVKASKTNHRVYLENNTQAHIYQDQHNRLLMQCDELAVYGSFHWDETSDRIDLTIGKTETLPEFMKFQDLLGLSSVDQVCHGTIVYNNEPNSTCADIGPEDLKAFLEVHWNFDYELYTAPAYQPQQDEYYINLWTDDAKSEDHKITLYSSGSRIKYGVYGSVPDKETGLSYPHSFVYYKPYRGNARNALFASSSALANAYRDITRPLTNADGEAFVTVDLLNLENASLWATSEVQSAAYFNLLPYRLNCGYRDPISRIDFCILAGQMLASRKNPNHLAYYRDDLEELVNDELSQKMEQISFTDIEHPTSEIKILAALGIITGRDDGSFDAHGTITRQEAATILGRMAAHAGKTVRESDFHYDDHNAIASWAEKAVYQMHALDVMHGMSKTEFAPKGFYTKEQAIATMLRLYRSLYS